MLIHYRYPLDSQTANQSFPPLFPPKEQTENKTKTKKNKMATLFLSTAKTFLPNLLSSSSPSPSSQIPSPLVKQQYSVRAQQLASELPSYPPTSLTKRSLSLSLTTTFLLSLAGGQNGNISDRAANAAILEADDDEELMERVKQDRKKRLEKQGVISSSNNETVYLQDVVYKLSKVGQAIENNDLSAANSVLGQSADTEWVQKAKAAFDKLSSSTEEKTEVDTFNSSLSTLISSVIQKDVEASKTAFFVSATAFEKWTTLTGLVGQLKGL